MQEVQFNKCLLSRELKVTQMGLQPTKVLLSLPEKLVVETTDEKLPQLLLTPRPPPPVKLIPRITAFIIYKGTTCGGGGALELGNLCRDHL